MTQSVVNQQQLKQELITENIKVRIVFFHIKIYQQWQAKICDKVFK